MNDTDKLVNLLRNDDCALSAAAANEIEWLQKIIFKAFAAPSPERQRILHTAIYGERT